MKSQISKKFNNLIHVVFQKGDLGQAVYLAFEDEIDSSKNPSIAFEKRFDQVFYQNKLMIERARGC